ncbi:glycosyltransferase [Jannaschia ovalis]|uniref:Glycosyltransferase n=1 Tax=Jannaschia ovalis TaxID=3038773 RepID=A0ABY8LFW9_9RHOB|nr:glycosyltransferase [Jannaschia sp. GRR-S6-38]WGH79064.1 glycosyltransferase [Jannaschia sp. GRR-S6-38]
MGALDRFDLARALIAQRETGAPLGETLLARGIISADALADALATQFRRPRADPRPDGRARDDLVRQFPAELALRLGAVPWSRRGGRVVIATSRPEDAKAILRAAAPHFGQCHLAVATRAEVEARIAAVHGPALARLAECRAPGDQTCRAMQGRSVTVAMIGLLAAALGALSLWPGPVVAGLTLLAVLVAVLNAGLRVAAAIASRRPAPRRFASIRPAREARHGPPIVTIFVPLHREPDIAGPLTRRLSRIEYPRERLDICLVVEEDDQLTRAALEAASLPAWIRVIVVPDGQPRTKPRAMNYALNFARGSIVGIYDAEDAPAPDQIRQVVARFHAAPPDLACLQGRLDFYNPERNWIARCFTMEYANWFRLVLPGIARMGLVVPLGGTTLFFRRDLLEEIGAWDAHNVTEDADLGVRLARRGYRTEIIDTTTLEEANAKPLAWVKQRSRWIKGYLLTWAVHSRQPLRLWRELGPKRALGFHLLFLGALLSPALLPLLWSLGLLSFGIAHPVAALLPEAGMTALVAAMISLLVVDIAATLVSLSAPHHRPLRKWIFLLPLYFPLATLALVKAIAEVLRSPFHWDKTEHGAFGGTGSAEDIARLEGLLSRAAARPGA